MALEQFKRLVAESRTKVPLLHDITAKHLSYNPTRGVSITHSYRDAARHTGKIEVPLNLPREELTRIAEVFATPLHEPVPDLYSIPELQSQKDAINSIAGDARVNVRVKQLSSKVFEIIHYFAQRKTKKRIRDSDTGGDTSPGDSGHTFDSPSSSGASDSIERLLGEHEVLDTGSPNVLHLYTRRIVARRSEILETLRLHALRHRVLATKREIESEGIKI